MGEEHNSKIIQIDITNICTKSCAYCTRAIRHKRAGFFMPLKKIREALVVLSEWYGIVGCIGGEPTIHPEFEEICNLFTKYIGYERSGLWTAGGGLYNKYLPLIESTFGTINFNDHELICYHQPLLIGSGEVVADEEVLENMIAECWVRKLWSPTVSINGSYFCEVAATIDLLFGLEVGWPVVPEWWRISGDLLKKQEYNCCRLCGMCLPLDARADNEEVELISKKNYQHLLMFKSNEYMEREFKILDNRELEKIRNRVSRGIVSSKVEYSYMKDKTRHCWFRGSKYFETL